MAEPPESSRSPPPNGGKSTNPPPKPSNAKVEDEPMPTSAQQRRTDWTIVKRLMVNVWPKNDWKTRLTVLFGFALLVMAKVRVDPFVYSMNHGFNYVLQVLNVQVPQIFKSIIDSLNVEFTDSAAVWVVAGSLILGCEPFFLSTLANLLTSILCCIDGAARIGSTLSSELLNAIFANISQRAIRKVARETFEHLLNLDLKFHLSRQTGGLTRAIDRGTKGISFLLQAILFRIAPTALEITMVCGILVCIFNNCLGDDLSLSFSYQTYKFGWDFAAITVLAMATYTWFTVQTTSWRCVSSKKPRAPF